MIRLQTPVLDEKCPTPLSYEDRILLLGSCFTDSIGRRLADYGFSTCVNPFGTLYNPISLLNSLERLAEGRLFTHEDCVRMGSGSGLTCSFSHHTSFARPDEEGFLTHANDALAQAHDFFLSSTYLIITLGTAWCYRHEASGKIVSNCLKRDAREFSRFRLSPEETTASLTRIKELAGNRKIVFTVSPIRHFKDGAHGNQLSKSTLLLSIDRLVENGELPGATAYFPAYEIMMDELRDYRFYSEDMTHPSDQATDYIRERFLDWALPAQEHPRLEASIRAYRHSQHREMH